jgi:hypothetical protein
MVVTLRIESAASVIFLFFALCNLASIQRQQTATLLETILDVFHYVAASCHELVLCCGMQRERTQRRHAIFLFDRLLIRGRGTAWYGSPVMVVARVVPRADWA